MTNLDRDTAPEENETMRKVSLKFRILTLVTMTAAMLMMNATVALAKLPPIRMPSL